MQWEAVLLEEMKAALGCTEPISVALACAKAASVLEEPVREIELTCSRSVIKNANSVVVPRTEGLKGIRIAAAAGAVGGNPGLGLEVLNEVCAEDIRAAARLVEEGRVRVEEKKQVPSLYIESRVRGETGDARVVISGLHDHFHTIEKNGTSLLTGESDAARIIPDRFGKDAWSVDQIYDYAKHFEPEAHPELRDALDRVIEYNMAISDEGLTKDYGLNVGKRFYAEDEEIARIIGRTAAASDARMGGSDAPVVVNSGSGNQGITTSIPVIMYGRAHDLPQKEIYRALVFSNLLAIYQKHFQGLLSSFCGVMSAATASVSAIALMKGKTAEEIKQLITLSLSTGGGVFCAGANAMCASKIAVSLQTAFMALSLVERGEVTPSNEGLAGYDADQTIREVGRLAKNSMQGVDDEILQIMLTRKPSPEVTEGV